MIAYEYGYTLEQIAALTPFQASFLAQWLRWRNEKLNLQ